LYLDNEVAEYVKRIVRGFEVDSEKIAEDIVHKVGPGGNFLAEEHTVRHFRQEMWIPGPAWTRQSWDGWQAEGKKSMGDRIKEQISEILANHQPDALHEDMSREIDRIVKRARDDLSSV
jgi:trimethylamine--corrinoid protein Co-methyltransferase